MISVLRVIISVIPYAAGLFMAIMFTKWYPNGPEYMQFVYFALTYLIFAASTKRD